MGVLGWVTVIDEVVWAWTREDENTGRFSLVDLDGLDDLGGLDGVVGEWCE